MAAKHRRKDIVVVLSRDLYEYVVKKIDGLVKFVKGEPVPEVEAQG